MQIKHFIPLLTALALCGLAACGGSGDSASASSPQASSAQGQVPTKRPRVPGDQPGPGPVQSGQQLCRRELVHRPGPGRRRDGGGRSSDHRRRQ